MASTSIQLAAGAAKSILTPVMTLKGHEREVSSMCYFPDNEQMVSAGSSDWTARQWNLQTGKEIKDARKLLGRYVNAVAVSRDGRWVIISSGDLSSRGPGKLNAWEVVTGIVKTFDSDSRAITCIDISVDNTLLAGGTTVQGTMIWDIDTGKLVAGPFKNSSHSSERAVRFSQDSRKLAVKSAHLEVWDVQSQKLDVSIGKPVNGFRLVTPAPVFWTNKDKSIVAALFLDTAGTMASTIYEFNSLTLEIIGAPFEGHIGDVTALTLSLDCTLLASASFDNTIKLWTFESRHLLASFDIQNPTVLILSPDSRQLAYTTSAKDDHKIYICSIPSDIPATISRLSQEALSIVCIQ
jgi:WD40 repeat protein